MKFKQYKLILESEKKVDKDPHPMFKDMTHYRKAITNQDEIIKLIKEKCDIKNYLYRGFEANDDYYIIDGSKGKRASKNTTNYYTQILDYIFKNDSKYKDYPLRSESIICSTSKNTASHYGETYVILPFKGVDIGYIGSNDMWETYIHIGEYDFQIMQWNRIFEEMGISDSDYWQIIHNLVREHNDALYTLKEETEEHYHSMHDEDDNYDEDFEATTKDIKEYLNEYFDNEGFDLDDFDSIVDHMSTGLTKYGVLTKMFGFEELETKDIENIIRGEYDPSDLGFELIETSGLSKHTDHKDIECWFGDKCVAVSIKKWDEIKKKI